MRQPIQIQERDPVGEAMLGLAKGVSEGIQMAQQQKLQREEQMNNAKMELGVEMARQFGDTSILEDVWDVPPDSQFMQELSNYADRRMEMQQKQQEEQLDMQMDMRKKQTNKHLELIEQAVGEEQFARVPERTKSMLKAEMISTGKISQNTMQRIMGQDDQHVEALAEQVDANPGNALVQTVADQEGKKTDAVEAFGRISNVADKETRERLLTVGGQAVREGKSPLRAVKEVESQMQHGEYEEPEEPPTYGNLSESARQTLGYATEMGSIYDPIAQSHTPANNLDEVIGAINIAVPTLKQNTDMMRDVAKKVSLLTSKSDDFEERTEGEVEEMLKERLPDTQQQPGDVSRRGGPSDMETGPAGMQTAMTFQGMYSDAMRQVSGGFGAAGGRRDTQQEPETDIDNILASGKARSQEAENDTESVSLDSDEVDTLVDEYLSGQDAESSPVTSASLIDPDDFVEFAEQEGYNVDDAAKQELGDILSERVQEMRGEDGEGGQSGPDVGGEPTSDEIQEMYEEFQGSMNEGYYGEVVEDKGILSGFLEYLRDGDYEINDATRLRAKRMVEFSQRQQSQDN